MKRLFTLLLVCAFIASAIIPTGFAFAAAEDSSAFTQVDNSLSDDLMNALLAHGDEQAEKENDAIPDDEIVTVMVVMEDDPILAQEGYAKKGFEDASYEKIQKAQDKVQKAIAQKFYKGSSAKLNVIYSYSYVLNGFAVELPYGLIDEINEMDGVKYAYMSGTTYLPELDEEEIINSLQPLSATANENQTEYRGKNTVISIIDSGMSFTHPLFKGTLADVKLTEDNIKNLITSKPLTAKQKVPSLSASAAYKSTKIPYQFDYGQYDTDATWAMNAHGIHVAGIAAGFSNVNPTVRPVAPDAQLFIMKVMDGNGAIPFASIMAALEDSALLGADVINISIGSEGGVTHDKYGLAQAFEYCRNAGITVAVACGNSAHYSDNNRLGGSALTLNPDTTKVNSPASMTYALAVANDNGAGSVSAGSSWGPVPDLTLKPEISSFGNSVNSSYASADGDSYKQLSGTSMASPHVAGGMAAVKQYLNEKYPNKFTGTELYNIVNTILMNTATQMTEINGAMYSPRRQGAGHMNLTNAVKTPAYVTVPGKDRPSIDKYDDPAETGEFDFEVTLHNMSDSSLTYYLNVVTQTEAVETKSGPDGNPAYFMAERERVLNPDVQSNLQDNKVTLPANGEVTVNVSLKLSRGDIEFFKTYYPNGGYVEGYIQFFPETGEAVNLAVPFLCFYGDWTRASVLDRGFYYDVINGDTNWASQALNEVFVSTSKGIYLGQNPYHSDAPYLADRNVLSPNGDGNYDRLEKIYISLLRSIKRTELTIAQGGTNYLYTYGTYWGKTIYNSGTRAMVRGEYTPNWAGTNATGRQTLPNNTETTVRMTFEVDYDKHAHNNENAVWEFPLTIDLEAPRLEKVTVRNIDGRRYICVTVHDNQFVSDISISDKDMQNTYASYAIAETERGLTKTYVYDVTGYGDEMGIIVSDYAANRSTYTANLKNASEATSSDPMPGDDGMTLDNALNVTGGEYKFTNDQANPWLVTETKGRLAAVSNTVGKANSRTSVSVDLGYLDSGTQIKFDWKISSEGNLDCGYFYVNDTNVANISGEKDWATYTYTVRTAGNVTLRWDYLKNGNTDTGSDKMWVDNVTVNRDIASVELNASSAELMVGEYYDLTYTILPEDAWNKAVMFSSSNPSVATVDENGKIHALAAGETTVTVTTEQTRRTATCTVSVYNLPQPREGYALVALEAPELWTNGSGYHLLLDRDAKAYGKDISAEGSVMSSGNADYSAFEYTVPNGAVGNAENRYVVSGGIEYIMVPAGVYDLAVVNPFFGGGVYFAGGESRYDDMELKEGYQYIFSVSGVTSSGDVVSDEVTLQSSNVGTTDATFEHGDVNMDGRVNAADATLILRHVVELSPLEGEALKLADVNNDKRVNSGDAAVVLKMTVMGGR